MSIRNRFLLIALLLLAPLALSRVEIEVVAQERVTLAAPVNFSQTGWDLSAMVLDVDKMQIIIRLRSTGSAALTLEKTYDGAVGDTLLRSLNKANLTTRSLIERTYDRLISDGVISGTVSGTPR